MNKADVFGTAVAVPNTSAFSQIFFSPTSDFIIQSNTDAVKSALSIADIFKQ